MELGLQITIHSKFISSFYKSCLEAFFCALYFYFVVLVEWLNYVVLVEAHESQSRRFWAFIQYKQKSSQNLFVCGPLSVNTKGDLYSMQQVTRIEVHCPV